MNTKKFYLAVSITLLTLLSISLYSSTVSLPKNNEIKKAIIIGASSGIGRQVAKVIAKNGFDVGLVGRRTYLLQTLQSEITTKSYIKTIDVSQTEKAILELKELISEMGGLDLMVIMAGAYAQFDSANEWESTKKLIAVDIAGYTAMALTAMDYFEKQKSGHLVGVSSIDALRGIAQAPTYCAAKTYASRLLEGLRNRMIQKNIPVHVTEILPGWVDVEHTQFSTLPGTFWVAPTEKAAQQIYDAINAKKKKAYITKRWALIAWWYKLAPDWLFNFFWRE